MEPKFQSSFIPKDSSVLQPRQIEGFRNKKEVRGGLLGFLAKVIFALSVLAAVGVFGYKFYLKYSIDRMKEELEMARVVVEPDTINELVRINNRIISTKELLSNHLALSPFFEFLQDSTARTVRFTGIEYSTSEDGVEVSLSGEANSYGALALQADIFKRSPYLTSQLFSDLELGPQGNVLFTFTASVNPDLLSYLRKVEQSAPSPVMPVEEVGEENQVFEGGDNQDTTI